MLNINQKGNEKNLFPFIVWGRLTELGKMWEGVAGIPPPSQTLPLILPPLSREAFHPRLFLLTFLYVFFNWQSCFNLFSPGQTFLFTQSLIMASYPDTFTICRKSPGKTWSRSILVVVFHLIICLSPHEFLFVTWSRIAIPWYTSLR